MKVIEVTQEPNFYAEVEVQEVAPVSYEGALSFWQKARLDAGWVKVEGVISTGTRTSRLCGTVSHKDLTGEKYACEMPKEAYEAGKYRTVQM